MQRAVERLKEISREVKLLEHTAALLSWDQETYMPELAVEERSEQLSLLEGLVHERITSPETAEQLDRAGSSDERPEGDPGLPGLDRAFLRQMHRLWRKRTKLPKDLVTRLAKQASVSQSVWIQARKESDFSRFAPQLGRLLDLVLEKASLLGFEGHPYDPLLDEYEPWMTTARVASLFDRMEPRLRELLGRISSRPQPEDSFLLTEYPVDLQERFGKQVLADMGYDFRRGRLDVSAHPFTTTLGRDDVRLTTRYNPRYFKTSIFGTIHEGGHGLYELGFDPALGGTILADAASLGIHESQSRLWENMIGRSRPFWDHYLPPLRELFPVQLDGVTLDRFYRAVNRVEPSLIRVEADEVTYSLHIILRFRLEVALLSKDLRVEDLPAAWNEQSERLLGIRPDSDAAGVLQDVHWSLGLFGYFPTYALGNLYAAQFLETMRGDLPGLDDRLREGNLTVILDWLRSRVHRHGSVFPASELCRRVTGSELDPDAFIGYLERKYAAVYGF